MSRYFSFVLLIAFFVIPSQAQDVLTLHRLSGPIILDGISDEPAWQGVEPVDLTMYQPISGGQMTERTEIRVAYDNDYLYVSGKMFDSEPDEVRANTLYRDRWSGDDTFAIVLDTFNDNENALWFFTSPNGVRFDMAVSSDANGSGGGTSFGGGAVNQSWNTYWDVETQQNEEGWFAEMRIPYSSLGFQEKDGKVEMGMILYRYIARKSERHIFPAIPPNWGMGYAKPSQARKIVLTDVKAKRPVYITPYVTGGRSIFNELNDAETKYVSDSEITKQVGLDIKYAITNNLTLDATFNTDFAQVEADDQQVNLTRFSLFFPEKRQFFQERSSLFDFSTGRRDRLFHSRNIGINEGETVRILGGGRMVGKIGAWDVGVIDMQTESVGDLPSENFGVLRFRRSVVNDQSFAGTMFTSRLGDDGSYNLAYGADASIKIGQNDYLTTKWAQTFEDEVLDADAFDFFQSGFFSAGYARRTDIGWSFRTGAMFAGRDYMPGSGFVSRTDYTQLNWDAQYGWLSAEDAPLRKHDGSSYGSLYFRNHDGSLESARVGGSWDFDFKTGASARTSLNVMVEDLLEELSFPKDTGVPVGRYTFVDWQGSYSIGSGNLLRGRVSSNIGSFYDGWRIQANYSPTWNVNRFLELSGSYQYTHLEFPDRNQKADIHLVGVRTQIGFNTKVSLNSFVQYNTSANIIASNIRFRYNFAEGNDLWFVYTENLNSDRHRESPVLPVSGIRTLLLKYTYTIGA
ncbi:MAG: carbohydrate binding family 9 domain-containing protein [Bacteroidetes Order II. Incertae sedis bacterium]|jgi:hypothetical protein|nr:carbohydrate binding family 9 domain-containing protein [Bacteroidetes Order II. bacterium]MBT4052033.1 carbohydrate binding family 9 domain-containing protein [Bacteroidetes Order II. bacterium]MBT4603465.1 carbohydrate binding family 9 domain-containing protein [Bacteroidetes Order II. bacterium]MBT5248804.1 carbohydrate binding family 9 domain-containing protein [Bacteroidetes Order II. bacterium]MBT6200064.1 carbohydrate binding family 9 domain-containing protein [Bacteroidetes Order II.